MVYQTLCTFDLKNASKKDYDDAYADLSKIGLNKVQAGSLGQYVIPTTTVLGGFTGTNAVAVANDVRAAVKAAFAARKFKSEIFVATGANGSWAADVT